MASRVKTSLPPKVLSFFPRSVCVPMDFYLFIFLSARCVIPMNVTNKSYYNKITRWQTLFAWFIERVTQFSQWMTTMRSRRKQEPKTYEECRRVKSRNQPENMNLRSDILTAIFGLFASDCQLITVRVSKYRNISSVDFFFCLSFLSISEKKREGKNMRLFREGKKGWKFQRFRIKFSFCLTYFLFA